MHFPPLPEYRDAVHQMVHRFYTRVREDDVLGPVFDRHITDWTPHLDKMVAFWNTTLLGSGEYRGTPMPAHNALPELSPELFARWLELFAQTTAETLPSPLHERADHLARRIAQSLWLGWQLHRNPDGSPLPLQTPR